MAVVAANIPGEHDERLQYHFDPTTRKPTLYCLTRYHASFNDIDGRCRCRTSMLRLSEDRALRARIRWIDAMLGS
jgi:hypothetical protein